MAKIFCIFGLNQYFSLLKVIPSVAVPCPSLPAAHSYGSRIQAGFGIKTPALPSMRTPFGRKGREWTFPKVLRIHRLDKP